MERFFMDKFLRKRLRENPHFQEVHENRFAPEFMGLIVNGVVINNVNWIDIVDKELLFISKDANTNPVASVILDNLDSLMIITLDGLNEVL